MQNYRDRFRSARALGFRSSYEVRISRELEEQGIAYEYEAHTIRYPQPAEERRYTADFFLPNGILVEVKGEFDTADRKKHRLIKAAHPDLDIRIVFGRSATRISKQSKTTYAKWCEVNGIPYADKSIPTSWLQEPINLRSLAALKGAEIGNP